MMAMLQTFNDAQITMIVSVVSSAIVSGTPIVAGLLFFERRLSKVEAGIEFIKQTCRKGDCDE